MFGYIDRKTIQNQLIFLLSINITTRTQKVWNWEWGMLPAHDQEDPYSHDIMILDSGSPCPIARHGLTYTTART